MKKRMVIKDGIMTLWTVKGFRMIVCLFLLLSFNLNVRGQNNMEGVDDKVVLTTVADKILQQQDLKFVDINSGIEYPSVKDVPDNVKLKLKNKYCNWHYTNGVLNMAMIHLSDYLQDIKYFEFARKHVAFGFDNYKYFAKRYNPTVDGVHWKYPLGELFNTRELDDFGAMTSSTIDVYQHQGGDKRSDYLDYAKAMGKFIEEKKLRLADKTFVRAFPEVNSLWGDDLYMSVPFLVRMTALTGDQTYLNDAIKQCINFDKYLWDSNRELYYHGYFTETKLTNVAHWGRCNGWILFAKIHLLSFMPKNHPQRQLIIDLLNKQILGLSRYQSSEGLWHQILDKTDSYLESSCSAMFVYAISKAVNEGWTRTQYASIALTGWEGLKKEVISRDGDMKNICEGTDLHNDLPYYYQRPYGLNEKHGLGALLDAGIETMKLKAKYPEIYKHIDERVHKNKESK